jgi:hypothetical protein
MIAVEKGNVQMPDTDNAIGTVVNVDDDMQNP